MGKCKNTAKGCTGAQKGTSPTPFSHEGEAVDTDDAFQDLIEEVASFEELLLQMGTSSKMPF